MSKCPSGTKKIQAALLLGLEEVKGCSAGNKQQSAELKLALHAEMLHREVVLPVVRQGLVEAGVFFICDVLRHTASFTGIGHKTMPNFEETTPNFLKTLVFQGQWQPSKDNAKLSSDLRIHKGLFLFSCSHSWDTSLTFLVFFFFSYGKELANDHGSMGRVRWSTAVVHTVNYSPQPGLLLLLLINLFNFGLISFFLLLSLLTFILTVSDLLLLALLHVELNGETDELTLHPLRGIEVFLPQTRCVVARRTRKENNSA